MNGLDYVILAVIGLSAIVGLWRGFFSEVMALAIWLLAFWVAWMLGPRIATYLEGTISDDVIRIIAAYVSCFIAVLIAGGLVRFVVSKLIATTGLGGTDRMLGLGFGLLRGVLITAIGVFLLGFTPFVQSKVWQQSSLLPAFAETAAWLGRKLPVENQRYLYQFTAGMNSSEASSISPHGKTQDTSSQPQNADEDMEILHFPAKDAPRQRTD